MARSIRVSVNPQVIQWAVNHGGKTESDLLKKYALQAWENPQSPQDAPTFKQLQSFSQDTRIPFNYFFNPDVPDEKNEFVKFRTVNNDKVHPSRRLIDTIHEMENQQAWMKDYLLSQDSHTRSTAVRQFNLTMSPETVAQNVLALLALTDTVGATLSDDEFFNLIRTKISSLGIMVMQNGIVGTNTHRSLDVTEFRAFVLIDDVIPLIFINSGDSKKAKIFSLIHEFVHILLGNSEILNVSPESDVQNERWINRVTSQVLMPSSAVKAAFSPSKDAPTNLKYLSRKFHVSLVATAIRLKSLAIYGDTEILWAKDEQAKNLQAKSKSAGGDFYNTAISRVDCRFANAVINTESSGNLAISEAASMLGVSPKTYEMTVDKLLGLV